MIAHVKTFGAFYSADWKNLFTLGVIMVSAITILVGVLKPLLFNRIKWKPLRRTCLAFTNVGLCFLAVAITFAIKHYDYSVYMHTAIATSIFSILWYWVYENTCLRDLISKIGGITLRKLYATAKNIFDKDDIKEVEKEFNLAVEKIKEEFRKESQNSTKSKEDKELKNL